MYPATMQKKYRNIFLPLFLFFASFAFANSGQEGKKADFTDRLKALFSSSSEDKNSGESKPNVQANQARQRTELLKPGVYQIELEGATSLGRTAMRQEILSGGITGAALVRRHQNQDIELLLTSSHGPRALQKLKNKKNCQTYLLPDYTPRWLHVFANLDRQTAFLVSDTRIKRFHDKMRASGLPPRGSAQMACDIKGRPIAKPALSISPVGLAGSPDSFYWSLDNYTMSLVQLNNDGLLMKRFEPPRKFLKSGAWAALAENRAKNELLLATQNLKDESEVVFFDVKSLRFRDKQKYLLEKNHRLGGISQSSASSTEYYTLEYLYENDQVRATKIYKVSHQGFADKTLVYEVPAQYFPFLAKPETLMSVDEKTLLIISQNDFGLNDTLNAKKIASLNDRSTQLIFVVLP